MSDETFEDAAHEVDHILAACKRRGVMPEMIEIVAERGELRSTTTVTFPSDGRDRGASPGVPVTHYKPGGMVKGFATGGQFKVESRDVLVNVHEHLMPATADERARDLVRAFTPIGSKPLGLRGIK